MGQLLDYQASITAANVVEASGTILVQAGSLIPTFGVDGELTQVQVAFGGAAPAAFAAAGQSAGFSFFTSTTITATNPPSDAIIPEPASALVWFTVAGLSLVALRARRKAKA